MVSADDGPGGGVAIPVALYLSGPVVVAAHTITGQPRAEEPSS